ncbi:MAG TPA: hypothetical protein VG899_16020, partial [Mycobacteriales bacterium]|nr:hypothetical protein [Mycobacteriales bacterium]
APGAKPGKGTGDVVLPPGGAIAGAGPGAMSAPPVNKPKPKPANRPAANRSNKRKRRGRR